METKIGNISGKLEISNNSISKLGVVDAMMNKDNNNNAQQQQEEVSPAAAPRSSQSSSLSSSSNRSNTRHSSIDELIESVDEALREF